MPYYKFKDNDIFVNTIEAYPNAKFYIHSGSIYINDRTYVSGTYSDNIIGVPRGFTSLYEYNINREDSQRIYPFVVKDGQKTTFKSISKLDWNTQFNYDGNKVTSSYNLSASISFATVGDRPKHYTALKNVINHYRYMSPHFDSSNYSATTTLMLDVPSIFYGSSIKKGTVNLKWYVSGTLAAQCSDIRYNGELIQVSGGDGCDVAVGSVVGTILYNEGVILLTSSADLSDQTIVIRSGVAQKPKWRHFGQTDLPLFGQVTPAFESLSESEKESAATGSQALEFQGTNHVQTMTMFAKAPYNELNNSNNPTYLKNSAKSLQNVASGSYIYEEGRRYLVNVVPSDYTDELPPMEKETYISKIALYDDDKNLIGFAKLATPVRKTADREFIFKLKLDL